MQYHRSGWNNSPLLLELESAIMQGIYLFHLIHISFQITTGTLGNSQFLSYGPHVWSELPYSVRHNATLSSSKAISNPTFSHISCNSTVQILSQTHPFFCDHDLFFSTPPPSPNPVCVCVCVWVDIATHIHSYICRYSYTHTHTHTEVAYIEVGFHCKTVRGIGVPLLRQSL